MLRFCLVSGHLPQPVALGPTIGWSHLPASSAILRAAEQGFSGAGREVIGEPTSLAPKVAGIGADSWSWLSEQREAECWG